MLINFDSKMIQYTNKTPHAIINSDCKERKSVFDQPINVHKLKVEDHVGYIEGVVPKEMCNYIISTIDNLNNWNKAQTVGESAGKVDAKESPRQNDILMISAYPGLEKMDKYLNKVYMSALRKYIGHYDLTVGEAGLTQDEGYQILRYTEGGYYKDHIDYASHKNPNGIPSTIRCVSGLIYLSDDQEGGEIYFKHSDRKLKPKAGSVVFFPSIFTHVHTSVPVTKGIKYCIVSWWK
jgi:predicted 2-oxoglutarate/Fe(II)-dependent dioxygenase YbiX